MFRRPTIWLALGAAAVCLWACGASAELNLWVAYHYAGVDSYESGAYDQASQLLQDALAETETKHRTASTLDCLGRVYFSQADYCEAEKTLKEALEIRECSLGRKSREVPQTLNNLADLYYLQGNTQEAAALYQRALDIHKRDQSNIEVCRSLNGLALTRNDAADYVEAEKLLKRAIAIHIKAQRTLHPFLATAYVNLGTLYVNLGRYCEAENQFKRAEYIQTKVLQKNHPDNAVRLNAYAVLLSKTDRGDEAAKMVKRAEAIRAQRAGAAK